MSRQGFVSLPFLVLFALCNALVSYLSYKSIQELQMMNDLKEINFQIQKERKIIEEAVCLMQCDEPESQYYLIDDELVWMDFSENECHVQSSIGYMVIIYDSIHQVLLDVRLEK